MRKQQIIGVAVDLFAEHGYAGTTMRAIAEGCAMETPSLYAHFASKEALLTAAREAVLREHREHFEALAERVRALPPLERLQALVTEVPSYYAERPSLVRFHMRTSSLMPELSRAGVQDPFRADEAVLAAVIRDAHQDGMRDGSLVPASTEALIAFVLCLMDGLFLQLAHYPADEHRRRTALVWDHLRTTLTVRGEHDDHA